MTERTLKVGTRGSRLALEQARRVREGLAGPAEVVVVRTAGDRFRERPLGEANSVGFFTKEIEEELLAGRIDLAVHSLKDLPVRLAPGLRFGALLARDDPADLLLARPEAVDRSRELPLREGARVGASSMRRRALLGAYRPDLVSAPIRGNVPTRIEKCARGDYDAILLSRAGPERLALDAGGLEPFEFNPRAWPGAPGQAVIAVETRDGDPEVEERLRGLDCAETRLRVEAERSLLAAYGGGCHAPFGAFCRLAKEGAEIFVAAPDPEGVFRLERFAAADPEAARVDAETWVRSGRPERSARGGKEWLCRPARPWC